MLFFIYAVIGMQVIRDWFGSKSSTDLPETCFLSCLLKPSFDSCAILKAELSEQWKNLYLALIFLIRKLQKTQEKNLVCCLFFPCLCDIFTAFIYI